MTIQEKLNEHKEEIIGIGASALITGVLNNTVLIRENRITKGVIELGLGFAAQFSRNATLKSVGKGVMMAGGSELIISATHRVARTVSKNHGIITPTLQPYQQTILNNTIYILTKKNPYFAYLYSKLSQALYPFEITFGQRPNSDENYTASFAPNFNNKGGSIDFRHVSALQYFNDEVEDSILSEFFRAYQFYYYVNRHHKVRSIDVMGSNVDFETKFFMQLVSLTRRGCSKDWVDMVAITDKFLINLINIEQNKLGANDKAIYFKGLKYYVDYHTKNDANYKKPITKYLPTVAMRVFAAINA